MGGRGRGRGGGARNAMSFNVEELGFRRGDALPAAQLAPPPLFPQVLTRPPAFECTDELEYLQALKEDFRTTMSKSPHFLKADEVKNSIERYSDRFKRSAADEVAADEEEERHLWHMPDKFFPAELTEVPKKKKKKKDAGKGKLKLKGDAADIASKLAELEKKEGEGDGEEEEEEDAAATAANKKTKAKKEKPEGGEGGDEEEDDEEEGEEGDDEDGEEEMGGNDYEQNYFDNGEDDANSSEDNIDEGGTY